MKKILIRILFVAVLVISMSSISSAVFAAAPTTITQPITFCQNVLGGQWRSGTNYADNGECFTGTNCQVREQNGIPRATGCDDSTYDELNGKKTAAVISFLSASQGLPSDVLQRLSTYEVRTDFSASGIDNLSGKCKDDLFFFIPTWYKYMPKKSVSPCELAEIHHLSDTLPILIAVVEILTRLAVFLAVGFIIWGGVKFILSQGEPEGIANARNTIMNAVIGLILTIIATALITFIGQRIS